MNNNSINQLLAEKVMGWHLRKMEHVDAWIDRNNDWTLKQMWKPATNIQDSLLVVEALQEKNNLNFKLKRRKDGKYFATFIQLHSIHDNPQKENNEWWDKADTAPMAICIAALKAVGEAI